MQVYPRYMQVYASICKYMQVKYMQVYAGDMHAICKPSAGTCRYMQVYASVWRYMSAMRYAYMQVCRHSTWWQTRPLVCHSCIYLVYAGICKYMQVKNMQFYARDMQVYVIYMQVYAIHIQYNTIQYYTIQYSRIYPAYNYIHFAYILYSCMNVQDSAVICTCASHHVMTD